MNVYLELNNFKGISFAVSAISEWQLTLSILNLLRFVAVALKKTHTSSNNNFLFLVHRTVSGLIVADWAYGP